jgi:hypothetical protein
VAERGLLAAAERSRLYQPRYLLAQFYFRRGNRAAFERWWIAALEKAPGDVTPLLDLAWRAAPDPAGLVLQAMAARPLIARQVVTFLVRNGNAGAARELAEHLAEAGGVDDLAALLGYMNQVLADANVDGAVAVWNTLCRRRLIPYEPIPGEGVALTNVDFAHAPLAAGFDWHFEPPAEVTCQRSGIGLHITFPGKQPEACVLAWQYVRLRRGAALRLESDAPSASGVV